MNAEHPLASLKASRKQTGEGEETKINTATSSPLAPCAPTAWYVLYSTKKTLI